MSLPPNLPQDILNENNELDPTDTVYVLTRLVDQINASGTSNSLDVLATTSTTPIFGLPLFGCGLLLLKGIGIGEPTACFGLAKSSAGLAGTSSLLFQQSGSGAFSDGNFTVTWPPNLPPVIQLAGCPNFHCYISWFG